MLITVTVTQDDINQGERNCCNDCPIARAVHRATGNPRLVLDDVSIWTGTGTYAEEDVASLPTAACEFIAAFDAGIGVRPFEFTIDIPDRYLSPEVTRA